MCWNMCVLDHSARLRHTDCLLSCGLSPYNFCLCSPFFNNRYNCCFLCHYSATWCFFLTCLTFISFSLHCIALAILLIGIVLQNRLLVYDGAASLLFTHVYIVIFWSFFECARDRTTQQYTEKRWVEQENEKNNNKTRIALTQSK